MSEIPPPTVPPATPPPPGGGSYTPPPPPPPYGGGPGAGGPPSSDRTIMLVLSYVWFLSLIPLFTKREDPEVQWHAKNGFVLAVAITIIDIIFYVISYFLPSMVACLITFVPCALGIGYLIVCVIGIIKAVNGQRMRIPVLTDYAEKLSI